MLSSISIATKTMLGRKNPDNIYPGGNERINQMGITNK
jgi:hypothetical protein